MKKADAILSVRLLAAPLLIPSVRAYADDDSPGNHRQREALRQDQRKLEQLRDPVRFASAAKFRRNVAQARRSEIPARINVEDQARMEGSKCSYQ